MVVPEGEIQRGRLAGQTLHPSKWTPRLDRVQKERDPNRALSSARLTAPQFGRSPRQRYLDGQR
jgi:hypothetical protein